MKNSSRSEGFTIVETLIVLAITGFFFVAVAALLSGKQKATEFSQGLRNLQTQLQQEIDDVSSGFYPNNGNIKCTAGPNGPVLRSAATAQGTNDECIFLGKVIQFAVNDPSGNPTDPEEYNIYTLTGLRAMSPSPNIEFASAKPKVIANDGTDANVPDVFETKHMPFGMTMDSIRYNNGAGPATQIGAIGLASSLGTLDADDVNQQVNVIAMLGTSLHLTKVNGANKANASLAPSGPIVGTPAAINPLQGIQICVKSGTTTQYGLLTIGGVGRQLSVNVSVKTNPGCT
jgi:type II secretory pathway pseudopilin PulG